MRKFPLGEVLFLKQKKSLEGVGDFFLFPLVKQLVDFLNSSIALTAIISFSLEIQVALSLQNYINVL